MSPLTGELVLKSGKCIMSVGQEADYIVTIIDERIRDV